MIKEAFEVLALQHGRKGLGKHTDSLKKGIIKGHLLVQVTLNDSQTDGR